MTSKYILLFWAQLVSSL